MAKTKVLKVPYSTKNGSLLHHESDGTQPEWRDNLPFHASLKIDFMLSGRSAKYLMLSPVNSPGDFRHFPMFVTDLIEVAAVQGIDKGGVMRGRWMVAKRGQNYGLRLAKEDE